MIATGPTVFMVPDAAGLLGLRADAVSATMALLVAFIGWIVMRYSRTYLDGEAREGAFHGLMLAALAVAALAWADDVGVTNYGDGPVRCRLGLELDGVPLESVPVELSPAGQWQRVFELTTAEPGRLTAVLDCVDDLAEDMKFLAYPIVPGPHGSVCVEADGKRLTPQHLSAMVLAEVKALQHGRASQLERAADSLRRLEPMALLAAEHGVRLRGHLSGVARDSRHDDVAPAQVAELFAELPAGDYLLEVTTVTRGNACDRRAFSHTAGQYSHYFDLLFILRRSPLRQAGRGA